MNKHEIAARLTVVERAIVNLAALVAELRQELIDDGLDDVVDSSHEPKTVD